MLSAKAFLIASFVIDGFIQILCNQPNGALSNVLLINVDDKSRAEELNSNDIEVIVIVSELSKADDSPDDRKCSCDNHNDECLRRCYNNDQRSFEEMFLLTATEVILGTAIIMGLSALVTILLRICTRSRMSRNSRNIVNQPDEFGRTGIRISLTSMQQRVMSKLRDRPPRYETRHNYEYQRRERSTRIPVLNPAAESMSSNVPPPSYEAGDINSLHELPPAYTIAIEDTGGIINPSFTSDESAARCDDGSANSRSDINTASRTSDSVLHM